jgi:hypothetical protein
MGQGFRGGMMVVQTQSTGQTQRRPHTYPKAQAFGLGRVQQRPYLRSRRAGGVVRLLVGAVLACAACGVADEGKLPPDVEDPAVLRTPAGAMARYHATVAVLPRVFDGVLSIGGILTDELAALPTDVGVYGRYTLLDGRLDLSGYGRNEFNSLHHLRAQAREARGFLGAYAPDSSPALRGHLYAVEGYAEIFLADLFCSGIPLSTVDFDGDYTLAAGSNTVEVYRHALTLFDSALALTNDDVRFQHLAAIGRGRALLALDSVARAA